MATHMIEIFGDLLYKDTRDEGRGVLPSPEDLKNKSLIKVGGFLMLNDTICLSFLLPVLSCNCFEPCYKCVCVCVTVMIALIVLL